MAKREAIRAVASGNGGRPAAGWRRVAVEIPVFGQPVTVAADVRDGRMTLADVVPLGRMLCDQMVAAGIRQSEAAGEPISCRKGCGACCGKYVVSITPPEGFRLIVDLQALPTGARDSAVRAFGAACTRLDGAGLHEHMAALRQGGPMSTADQADALGEWWTRNGFDCPMLRSQSCLHYGMRPLMCREFLATSDPSLCGTTGVKRVRLPVSVAEAMLHWSAEMEDLPPMQEMFVNLLPWYENKRTRAQRTWRGPEMVRRFLEKVRELAAARG